MPTYPNTSLTQALAPFYGSCKLEVSTDNGTSWTNAGLARGVVFNEVQEQADIQADNGPDLDNYVANHTVDITFNALEFYLPTFNKIRGGIDNLTATSAIATTDTDVYTTGSVSYNKTYFLDNPGDSSTLAAIASIKSVDTGNSCDTLDSTRDYSTFIDANNKPGFIILSTGQGGTFKDTESLRVNYVYGAVQSYKLTSGGKTSVSPRWWRLTNLQVVNSVSKYRYLVIYNGYSNTGLNLAFKSANETDPVLESPFTIRAKIDSTRTSGDQLFSIEDGVATA